MKRHAFIFFLVVLLMETLCPSEAIAQQPYPAHTFESRVVVGSHVIGGKNALQDRVYGLDLSYQKNISRLSDGWVKVFSATAVGASVIFRDLNQLKGHQDTSANSFGKAYGISGHFDVQLLKSGRSSLTFRPAIGLSYLSKTFFTNKSNRFIGSHLNEILKFDLLMQMPVSSRVDFIAGAGFLHYSNGGYSIPNHGLNLVSVSTGLRFIKAGSQRKENPPNFEQLRRSSFELGLGIGRRGVVERQQGLMRSGLYAGYNLFLNNLLTLKSGFDAVFYYTPYDPAPGKDIETFQAYGTSYEKWRTGLSLGAELKLWRLAISGQAGKYLHYNSYYKDIGWFWTAGVAYHISPHLALQAKPYFHGAQADFINYGFAVKF